MPILCAIALVALCAVPLLDTRWMGMPDVLIVPSRWLQFGLMFPLNLLGGLFCFLCYRSRALEWVLVLMFFGTLAGILAQHAIDSAQGYDVPLEFAGMAIAAMFALARVRFWIMLPSALIGFAAMIGNELLFVTPGPSARYHLFSTTLLVVLGACAGYSSEYFIRGTWLNSTLLHYLCHLDGLTGLLNRPALESAVSRVHAHARRESFGYAVAMIDIDSFGLYNDHYGHQLGDQTLRQLAAVLAGSARRRPDVCGRYGGEEFLLLWQGSDAAPLFALAESVRAAVAAARIPHEQSPVAPWITISIGIVHVGARGRCMPFETVLNQADRLLYEAKSAGRNRMCWDRC